MANPYGHDHRKRRAALIPAALGTRCPLRISRNCVGIMTNPRRMELDHSTPLILGGQHGDRIVCSSCNRSAGASLGNRLRKPRAAHAHHDTPARRRTRDWKPPNRTLRTYPPRGASS